MDKIYLYLLLMLLYLLLSAFSSVGVVIIIVHSNMYLLGLVFHLELLHCMHIFLSQIHLKRKRKGNHKFLVIPWLCCQGKTYGPGSVLNIE